jgi:uncharacterized membrane protein
MEDQAQRDQSREKKRAQFADSEKSKNKLTPVLIAIFVVLIIGGAYAILRSSSDSPASTTVTPSNPDPAAGSASNADIKIPISDLNSGKAKFFDYNVTGNKAVRFFAVRSSDGVYRAAMDACDTCFHAKKGYKQEGDNMICNNCGLKFPTNQINEIHGGCNPVGIACKVEGDTLVIKANELESRSKYF